MDTKLTIETLKKTHDRFAENNTKESWVKTLDEYINTIKEFILDHQTDLKKIFIDVENQNNLYEEKRVEVKMLPEIISIYKEYNDGMMQFANELAMKIDAASENEEFLSKLEIALKKDGPFIDSLFIGDIVKTESQPVSVAVENLVVASEYTKLIPSLKDKVTGINISETSNNVDTIEKVQMMARSSVEYFAYLLLNAILCNYTQIHDGIYNVDKKDGDTVPFKLF